MLRLLISKFSIYNCVLRLARLIMDCSQFRQILVVTAHWNRAHESFFYNATNIKTHPAMATRRKEQVREFK